MGTKMFVKFFSIGMCLFEAFSIAKVYYHTASETKQAIWSPFNRVNYTLTGLPGYFYFYEYNISHYITSPPETTISLELVVLDIPNNSNCTDDHLIIYDGDTTANTRLVNGCFPMANVTAESTGNSVLVQFLSIVENNNYNDFKFGFILSFWTTGRETSDKQIQNEACIPTGYKTGCIVMTVVAGVSIIINLVQCSGLHKRLKSKKLNRTTQPCSIQTANVENVQNNEQNNVQIDGSEILNINRGGGQTNKQSAMPSALD